MPTRTHQAAPSRGAVATGLARGLHRPWLLVVPALTLVLTAVSLWAAGSAGSTELNDPGGLVRWGLPLAESILNLSMAVVMGSLLFATCLLPRFAVDAAGRRRRQPASEGAATPERGQRAEYPPFTAALNLGAVAALTWTIAALCTLVLSYADISGTPPSADQTFTSQLLSFMQNIPAGQIQTTLVVVGAVVTTLIFGVRSLTGLLLTLGLSFVGIVAMALGGHSSGGDDHMGAVNSLGLHLLGVCLWFGGLLVLAYLSRQLGGPDAGTGTVPQKRRGTETAQTRRVPMAVAVLRRYSAVALAGFILVSVSGVLNAAVRVHGWHDLTSTYGLLIVVKAALTVLLGLAGAVHRLWLIPRVESGETSAFRGIWQVIAAELIIFAGISAAAVTLSRTAPPVNEDLATDASPARIITWYDAPPEPQGALWFTTWRPDWFWVAVALFAAWAYVWAFIRVRRGGGRWNPLRLASWLVGLACLTVATSGSLAVYARVLFSVHMMEHMSLTMIIPIFLVLGAPVTLLLQALEPRQDGTRGPREWILRFLHSTFSKVVTHPIFVGVNFAASLIVFYFTPLFGVALRYHVGHEFMMVHFLITGYLFALVLIGIDPIPHRPTYPFRIVMLIATLGYHAFVGIAIMSSDTLLQASWYGNLGLEWAAPAIEDQQRGGAFMWALGEIPTMVVAVIVAVQWSRSDRRLAERLDRKADRDGDAELEAYNEMLERMQERGGR
ncbi:bifunctional copper resistance protein CopD/cytochrome c oxidase assembly protein [Rothia sp. AR01]|uniref:Bifunctional copper resistance protein CopD/cytochrome c oxidase assembly protein n=1 Tax=Rothia santali TaxID=2949643 RepID=A0A9X2HCZ1_9MICC|nr:cytochrome c oxidase assembly protein [Rothia santali]MCP3425442.1 bifunctional copper resistance protein CopD/cytochrome c oxidase assembly protein [Rothia santali]